MYQSWSRAPIVPEPSFQKGLDDLELREAFSWTCGVAGSSLTSACHPAALSCLAAEIAALCLYRPARGSFRFRHYFMRAERAKLEMDLPTSAIEEDAVFCSAPWTDEPSRAL